MAFDYVIDGHLYHLDTNDGEVHCKQLPEPELQPQPLEPSDEETE